jgi:hypothetical protein
VEMGVGGILTGSFISPTSLSSLPSYASIIVVKYDALNALYVDSVLVHIILSE